MKLKKIKLKNFRSYKNEVEIEISEFNAFIGKNDIGKSTILEALDIFFNDGKGIIKIDKSDMNNEAYSNEESDITISLCFENLPTTIIIDSTNETDLDSEYLLNSNKQLEIIKKYQNGSKLKIFIKALHPTEKNCKDLLQKKDSELRELIDKNDIFCEDKSRNAIMRKAIRAHFKGENYLQEIEIDITKGETKSIWDKLINYLPVYSLFQSDRKNSDGDSEIQDPLKEAVKQIINDEKLKQKLNEIALEVENKLKDVSNRTLEKVREMNPEIANSLNPVIPPIESLKWNDVFKNVSISGDQGIPINKRGSGIKRLILLNFFRAEAERRQLEQHIPSIIYAIEEPETSQHSEHQRILIKSLLSLTNSQNTQIIITTHSPNIVKELKFAHLRLISLSHNNRTIENVKPNCLPYPSLNEVNYLAFEETTEEYHNELFGYIEHEGLFSSFASGKPKKLYKKNKNGKIQDIEITLTEYIRHQIHHPENQLNQRFSLTDLKQSIDLMRKFIIQLNTSLIN